MHATLRLCLLLGSCLGAFGLGTASDSHTGAEPRYAGDATPGVSFDLFLELERLSRLVDIAYCVGTTGISHPFSCVSRCKDFPTLDLVATWNTGILLSDSCGYIAVDHGAKAHSVPSARPVSDQPSGQPEQGVIVVAFRGTYSITNTVIDLSTTPQKYVPYPSPDNGGEPPENPEHECDNCTVHTGFLSSWDTARNEVLPALTVLRAQYPNYPIHLVGHSLGGAVAALAALELKVSLHWDDVIVTTFGEPRVGNEGWARFLNSVFDLKNTEVAPEERSYRRLTHVDDPVPLLPLSEWGYESHAGEIFISKAELSPSQSDLRFCNGDYDSKCIAGSEGEELREVWTLAAEEDDVEDDVAASSSWGVPSRYKLWQLFFAHRDYFWRLGLCVPGGDPFNWNRGPYAEGATSDEL